MMPGDQEYQNHLVFTDLDQYIGFYDSLADSIFQFMSCGTSSIGNIDTYSFLSMRGTLSSIRTVLENGQINDAYALLRKFYDSSIITIYTNLYLEEHFSVKNFIVEKIDNWLKGREELPEYRIMSSYIRNASSVKQITRLLYSNDRYKKIRKRCNDHTHYNFYHNVLLNEVEIYATNRGKALDEIVCDIRDIIILHLSYLFFAKHNYLRSSDYIDALECGCVPELDSEYWVAPFIQKIFDTIIAKYRPDIAKIIKENTSMQLK